jgi:hypothetical protein
MQGAPTLSPPSSSSENTNSYVAAVGPRSKAYDLNCVIAQFESHSRHRPPSGFSLFSSVPRGKCRNSVSVSATVVAFHFLWVSVDTMRRVTNSIVKQTTGIMHMERTVNHNSRPSLNNITLSIVPLLHIWAYFLFLCGALTPFRVMASPYGALLLHSMATPHSAGPLWTSDQPDAKIFAWQHTTLTRDRHPCPRRDLNPQSQQHAATGIGRFGLFISQLKHVEGKTVASRLLNRTEILKFTCQQSIY